jgi:hypothetical protein
MLKVSNSIPISNYSQVVISDNAGATFKPKTNSRVRLNLPSSLGMIDFHSSYIQLNTKTIANATHGTTNTYKMGWGNRQGVNQIIRDLIIRVDGKALETITNYNVLDKAQRDYANDLTLNNLESTWSHATLQPDNPSYSCTDWDCETGTFNYNNISTKNQLQLDLSGLLSMKTGFPIVASGNVEIEFILEDAENCLVPLHNLNAQAVQGFTTDATGTPANGYLELTLDASAMGFTVTDHPFANGNVFELIGYDTTAPAVEVKRWGKVTGVTTHNGNKIRVTCDGADGTVFPGSRTFQNVTIQPSFNGVFGADHEAEPALLTSLQWNYEVSNVEFVARAIEMPPPYVSALQKRIQGEGMILDCPTYSMYLSNIQQNLIKQSLLVPCYGSRVKGVVSVPVASVQTPYRFDRNGKVDGLREYQAKIGSRVEPQRPVDLSNWTIDNTHQYHAQEHIQELTKTLSAVGIGERSLTRWRDNFLITRRLGAMGGSEDLSEKGFRWEIQYNTNTNTAKNAYNFVSMVRRIQILPTWVSIFG